MYLKRLRYRSYRNLNGVEFTPVPGFNIFWGRNGQGKTNLLEGIYLLGHLKSFRGALAQAMIGDQQQSAEIESELISGPVSHRLDLSLTRQGKDIRLDGKRPKKIADVAEKMRQVLFSPEEVTAVKGAPGLRRSLIDRAVFQLQPSYLERMQGYYRVLKQRNQLLRNGREKEQTEVWAHGLIQEGARIRVARQRFIEELKPFFEDCYRQLTGAQEKPQIDLRSDGNGDLEQQQQLLKEEFARTSEQERHRRTTLAGPHRDDPQFYINNQDLRSHGSQGQQRTFVLAYKIALLNLLKEKTGRTAILMLDDITSELDEKRRQALFTILKNGAGQVFVTTTDPKLINTTNSDDCQFFEVEQGQVYTSSTTTR